MTRCINEKMMRQFLSLAALSFAIVSFLMILFKIIKTKHLL